MQCVCFTWLTRRIVSKYTDGGFSSLENNSLNHFSLSFWHYGTIQKAFPLHGKSLSKAVLVCRIMLRRLLFCSTIQDFDGQRRAETYFEVIVGASSVSVRGCVVMISTTASTLPIFHTLQAIGFIAGYYLQLFSITVIILAVGFLLASLVSC